MRCTILDYGTGTMQSVENALKKLGNTVDHANNPQDISNADVLIFPGQGAFGPSLNQLSSRGLLNSIQTYVQSKRPFIGICLGFQLLFRGSQEAKDTPGIGCFDGHFQQFNRHDVVVPHMGWNPILATSKTGLLHDFNNACMYFVHSYYLPISFSTGCHAITHYGHPFISAMTNDTQLLTQFHPEKSGDAGLALLNQFLKGLP